MIGEAIERLTGGRFMSKTTKEKMDSKKAAAKRRVRQEKAEWKRRYGTGVGAGPHDNLSTDTAGRPE